LVLKLLDKVKQTTTLLDFFIESWIKTLIKIICLQVTNFESPQMHLELLKTLNTALDVAHKFDGIGIQTEMLFSESMLDRYA